MEIRADHIFKSLQIVWDGNDFVQVKKKSFKEINPAKVITNIIKVDKNFIDDAKEIKAILYRKFLMLTDEFNQLDDMYDGPEDFIRKEGYESGLFDIKANGIIAKKEVGAIVARLKLMADKHCRNIGDPSAIKGSLIKEGLAVVIDDVQKEKLDVIKSNVKYDPAVKADWDKLLKMMRINSKDERGVDMRKMHIDAIKHFIWQVKCKLHNLPVKYHLCLVLYGSQGCGKSDFLRQFCAPMEDVYCLIDGDNISDKFSAELYENHYVANLDELSKINSNSIEQIKQFITTEDVTSRSMHTQSHAETKQNMTLIGSSNRPIDKAVRDYTGMRRWWQIEINRSEKTMDFDTIEANDFIEYWQSIDETQPGFYGRDNKAMHSYQDQFTAVNSVKEFCDSYCYECDYQGETSEVKAELLYNDYKDYAKRTNHKPLKFPDFRASMQEIGFKSESKRLGTRKINFIRIDKIEGDEFE